MVIGDELPITGGLPALASSRNVIVGEDGHAEVILLNSDTGEKSSGPCEPGDSLGADSEHWAPGLGQLVRELAGSVMRGCMSFPLLL